MFFYEGIEFVLVEQRLILLAATALKLISKERKANLPQSDLNATFPHFSPLLMLTSTQKQLVS